MSAGLEGSPVEWAWPCNLRDQTVIEALPPEVRASVERYIRSRLEAARSGGYTVLGDDAKDDDYVRGWKDGVEAMQDEISSAYVPPPSRRRHPSSSPGAR